MLPAAVKEYKEGDRDSEQVPSEAEASEEEERPHPEAELISEDPSRIIHREAAVSPDILFPAAEPASAEAVRDSYS